MPARSPEAVARKYKNKLATARNKRAVQRKLVIEKAMLAGYKIAARRMRPRLPDNITKAELREMLAKAVRNTVNR